MCAPCPRHGPSRGGSFSSVGRWAQCGDGHGRPGAPLSGFRVIFHGPIDYSGHMICTIRREILLCVRPRVRPRVCGRTLEIREGH